MIKLPDTVYKTPYNKHQINAQRHFLQGDFKKAEEEVKASLKIDPYDLSNYYALGAIYYNLGDFDTAITNLEKDSLNDTALFLIARIYYEKENWNKAIEYAKKAIGINPKAVEPHRLLGTVYFEEKEEAKEAEQYYKKITRINYHDAKAHYSLASCYAAQKKYRKAIRRYKKAIRLSSNIEICAFAYYWIGYHYIEGLNEERKGLNAFIESFNLGYSNAYEKIIEFGLENQLILIMQGQYKLQLNYLNNLRG